MIHLDYSLVVTIFYVVILYAFMSRFFFRPITRILRERRQLIEGRLEAAEQSIAEADRKTADYEHSLKAARAETFRRQEAHREKMLAERSELINQAKAEVDKTVQEARARLLTEAESASRKLDSEVDNLARSLTTVLLQDPS